MRPPGRAEIAADLERLGVRPSRALGQNFLVDPNLAERIARLASIGQGDDVLEVGAGCGSLTVALAATGARVVALEIDRHLLPVLEERVAPLGVEVVQGDAMRCDWKALLQGRKWALVANLPYNIATPLVLDLLREVPELRRMVVMVQLEVAERLVARPATPAYGAVSARAAYFSRASLLARVPASVFMPRPKVGSAVVEIVRLDRPPVPVEEASFEEIDVLLAAAFSTRRKMLRRSLAPLVSPAVFASAGVSPTRRPEELSIVDWGRLASCRRQLTSERP